MDFALPECLLSGCDTPVATYSSLLLDLGPCRRGSLLTGNWHPLCINCRLCNGAPQRLHQFAWLVASVASDGCVLSALQLFRADDRAARRHQASAELGVDVETLKSLPRAVRQAAAAGAPPSHGCGLPSVRRSYAQAERPSRSTGSGCCRAAKSGNFGCLPLGRLSPTLYGRCKESLFLSSCLPSVMLSCAGGLPKMQEAGFTADMLAARAGERPSASDFPPEASTSGRDEHTPRPRYALEDFCWHRPHGGGDAMHWRLARKLSQVRDEWRITGEHTRMHGICDDIRHVSYAVLRAVRFKA